MNRSLKMSGPPREKTRDEIDMKLLRELATLPANKFCFDCGQRGPTYVNVTIGAFVCSACGGLLRGLNPPHRVKSLTVCSFTEVEMDRIKSRGNEYCTHIWLGKYDPKTENIDLTSPEKRKEFMIMKYEDKKFYIDPREAVKKMKPRAPAIPSSCMDSSQISSVVTSSAVPRSQTVMPNSSNKHSSTQIQRPTGVGLSQAFSAGDLSRSTTLPLAFESDPFQDNEISSGDGASFADFSSAFGNTVSKESPSIQVTTTTTSSSSFSSHHKKQLAPPPPDRYAALADLDNQLHQTDAPPDMTPAFWTAPTAVFSAPGVQNPFHAQQAWSTTAQNPFQVATVPPHANMMPKDASLLPNGNTPTVYWPSVPHTQVPSPWGKADPFATTTSNIDKYNPWAHSFGGSSANPFTNGSVSGGGGGQGMNNPKNPFL